MRYFQDRPHGYAESSGELHRIDGPAPAGRRSGRCAPRSSGVEELLPRLLLPNGLANGAAEPLGRRSTRPGSARRSPSSSSSGPSPRWRCAPGCRSRPPAGWSASGGLASPRRQRQAPGLRAAPGLVLASRAMNSTHPKDRRPQRIAVLPGDGIGKDVTVEAVKVLEAAAETWEPPPGAGPLRLGRRPLPRDRRNPAGRRPRRLPRQLRRDLHRRLRRSPGAGHEARRRHPARHPLRARPLHQPAPGQALRRQPLPAQGPDGEGHRLRRLPREHRGRLRQHRRQLQEAARADEVAVQEEIHTRKGVERIIRAAFEYAVQHGRREVVHERQVERDALRPRPLAARASPRSPRSTRRSSRATCSWTP